MTEKTTNKVLYGQIIDIEHITNDIRHSMFNLMDKFYFAEKESFFEDLSKKDSVILLRDDNSLIRGFTSSQLFDLNVHGKIVKILFSGDTIIHPDYWGSLELPRTWGKYMLDTIAKLGNIDLFWFLISSGFKTYRFLPAYFHEFFPRHDIATPKKMQETFDAAAYHLFSEKYNAETGIIKLQNPTPLKNGISDPTESNIKNPHIAFFLEKNPGYIYGDELACITRLTTNNIKPFVKRLIKA